MAGYKLATYQTKDGPRAGLVVDDKVIDAAKATGKAGYASVVGILNDWSKAQGALKAAAAKAGKSKAAIPLSKAKLLAPLLYPSTIYCAGANYQDHANEMAAKDNRPPPPDPHTLGLESWHFIKASRSISHPGATVKISGYSQKMDWEVELAAVIGKPAKNVPKEKALSYVAGYTIANDLSARDVMKRAKVADNAPFKFDWVSQKCFDGACPLGPWIVPASQIPEPHNLGIKLWVGEELMQDSNTSRMIFDTAEQIEMLSSRVTLRPGDLVLTGTPAGVGMPRRRFLKPGETLRLWIEGIGELVHGVTAA